jgi:hypothetical protein
MTEAEWLACEESGVMLEYLRDRASERKLRLFVCSCCRHVWHQLEECSRDAVEIAERYSDGTASEVELLVAAQTVEEARAQAAHSSAAGMSARHAAHLAAYAIHTRSVYVRTGGKYAPEAFSNRENFVILACIFVAEAVSGMVRSQFRNIEIERVYEAEYARQAGVVRDIFGDPFRPGTFDAAWRTSTVLSLAKGMYESRDFSAMPILADALQDAGCDCEDILNHCRDEEAKHVRGCWVVDLVLEK